MFHRVGYDRPNVPSGRLSPTWGGLSPRLGVLERPAVRTAIVLLAEMEAEFERWSGRLVREVGKENVLQTIEHIRRLKDVLDADADTEHLKAARRRRTEI
jgi:hypothetical protein